MKIIITLLVLITLGIVVGSNLLPTMTVVILNQPTVALPIGVWLMIAVGAGLLSSSLIQLLVSVDRRLLKRQIRQLQSRSPQQGEDTFTYTSPATEADSSSRDKSDTPSATTSRFKSYRSNLADRFNHPPSAQPRAVDEDDWKAEPAVNRQLDWEDPLPQSQQNLQSSINSSTTQTERISTDRSTEKPLRPALQTSREVYDADFRLIQPPYKEPLETKFDDDRDSADFEYTQTDEDDRRSTSPVKSTSPNRATPSTDLDDEDWGFDFDERDPPARKN